MLRLESSIKDRHWNEIDEGLLQVVILRLDRIQGNV